MQKFKVEIQSRMIKHAEACQELTLTLKRSQTEEMPFGTE